MTRLRRFLADDSGAAAVEFAIVGMVFLVLCVGLIDFGRNFDSQSRLAHAADVAARALFLDPAASESQLAARIQTAFPTLGYDRMTLRLTSRTVAAKSFRQITLSLPLRFFTPGFTGRDGTLSVTRLVPLG